MWSFVDVQMVEKFGGGGAAVTAFGGPLLLVAPSGGHFGAAEDVLDLGAVVAGGGFCQVL